MSAKSLSSIVVNAMKQTTPPVPQFLRPPAPGYQWVYRPDSPKCSPESLACWHEVATPLVPQWQAELAKAICHELISRDLDFGPSPLEALIAIIAAHAPQGHAEDGARLDWLEKQPAMLCAEGDGKWSCGGSTNFIVYAHKPPSIRAAIDAARQEAK